MRTKHSVAVVASELPLVSSNGSCSVLGHCSDLGWEVFDSFSPKSRPPQVVCFSVQGDGSHVDNGSGIAKLLTPCVAALAGLEFSSRFPDTGFQVPERVSCATLF